MNKETNNRIWGNASLVTGILSLVLFLMPYFALPLGIFAIVSSSIQSKRGKTGSSNAGLVLGIIGTIINFTTLMIMLLFISAFA